MWNIDFDKDKTSLNFKYSLDMCRFNLRCRDEFGEDLMKNPTAILTNSATMGEYLARRCEGGHRHVRLKGGARATRAAVYTAEFCQAVVEGYKLHKSKLKERAVKQYGSLKERDQVDSSLNTLELSKTFYVMIPLWPPNFYCFLGWVIIWWGNRDGGGDPLFYK